MESDIRDEQAIMIAEMQNALERLSRIHSSLTLLTKLENEEYDVSAPVNMSVLVKSVLGSFEELIEMKSLRLEARVGENVLVPLHPALADLLLMNLVGNAIRHNSGEGWIAVDLTREGLVISNSGNEPQVPVGELFERFKKGSPGGDSIGIGLAIVRQICDLTGFTIEYQYLGGGAEGSGRLGVHSLAVGFTERVPASRLLQNLALPLQHVKTVP